MKGEIRDFASISAAFGPVDPIHLENPGGNSVILYPVGSPSATAAPRPFPLTYVSRRMIIVSATTAIRGISVHLACL